MTATPTPVGVAVGSGTERQLKRGLAAVENSSGKLKKGTTSRGATSTSARCFH